MLKNITMRFRNLKSIFPHQLWQVLEHLSNSMQVAFWLILMTLYLAFFLVIWLLDVMLRSVLGLVLTLVEYEASMRGYEGVKYSTQALFPSLKNLRQQLSAALKMELGAVRLLFTSLFGTKR